ncbi:MAG: glycosyl transferase [Candidatus Saccharibacteria bacterium]|nr:glycosyl transferase [Candidatus Saccharibacteria bacterium]
MKQVDKVKNITRKSLNTLKNEGIISFGIKSLTKIQKKRMQTTQKPSAKRQFISLVDRKNVIDANWTSNPYKKPVTKTKKPYTISWLMSPPSTGGGHQNIFRFIEFLDKQGYSNHIYLYSTFDDMTVEQAQKNVKSYCNAKNLTFSYFKGEVKKSDIVFATGWETAYPVFNLVTSAHKMYFVQDFEPFFYPIGTDYVLAENTYKFGFFGITAGGWLAKKLKETYGMRTANYDFGADTSKYKLLNSGERKDVFFYARPVTERRGFDLGVMALEIFHKRMPEYTIHMAGWDVSEWDVPFPYVNHGAVSIDELPVIYNKSAVALVLSLTNMSLLPLELLASGTIPIVNDADNNRLVSNNPYIKYAETSPESLAQAMIDVINRDDLPAYALQASKSVDSAGWETAGKTFIEIIDKELGNV